MISSKRRFGLCGKSVTKRHLANPILTGLHLGSLLNRIRWKRCDGFDAAPKSVKFNTPPVPESVQVGACKVQFPVESSNIILETYGSAGQGPRYRTPTR